MPNNVNYAAAKGGLEAMTRSFAGEWAGRGVRVNAIAPGPCRTAFTESLYQQEGYVENLLKKIPRGEIATPMDMIGPFLLLSTRAGANITGQTLIVDGGFTII
jgi:2-deoxy-D-gluconate 3-dehydrogenase